MRHLVFLAMVAIGSAGCVTPAIGIAITENPEIQAELLFTHDGCKIYRFRDGQSRIYYADCRAPATSSASTSWNVSCGRNCTKRIMVSTVEPGASR
jgi:hypothetical protein